MEMPKYVVKAFILKEVKYHGTEFVYEETEAIPIEWLERWSDSMTANAYGWSDTGYQVIHSVIEDWRKENE